MHGDPARGHNFRQGLLPGPCHTGVQACRRVRQEAYCATHWYKKEVQCSENYAKYVDYKRIEIIH